MVLGALLIFEGVFGVVREVADGDSSKGSGLFAAVVGIAVGISMIGFHDWLSPERAYQDPQPITGEIVDVRQTRSDGDTMYKAVYGYEVQGQEYTTPSSVQQSMRPPVGKQVEMVYDRAYPHQANRAGGFEGNVDRIVFWIGVLILVPSIFSLIISLLLISFGVYLLLKGRRERRKVDPEDRPPFMSSLVNLWTDLSSGRRDTEAVLAEPLDEHTPR